MTAPHIVNLAPPRNLKQLQRLAAAAIRQPLNRDDRTRKLWYDGQKSTSDIAETFIKPNDRLTSIERLEIYNRQYWFRLMDCLYDDYPGLRAILGENKFRTMCRAYLEAYPSRSFTLRNLGSRLRQFLAQQPQWAGKRQHMVLDMARFEWAQVVAFDGPANPPLPAEIVAHTDPQKLKLSLQPYLTLLEMAYPLDEFIIAVKKQNSALRTEASNAIEAPAKKSRGKKIPLPRRQAAFVAVHRHDNMLFYKRLDPAAFGILAALQAGQSLTRACQTGIRKSGREVSPQQIGSWFELWASLGWLCRR